MGGGAVSSWIEALAVMEVLLALSRNWAETLLRPLPAERFQGLMEAKGSQALQLRPSLLNRMSATTPLLSEADSVRVTAGLVVKEAPWLMTLVPIGASVSVRITRLVLEELTVWTAVKRPKVV